MTTFSTYRPIHQYLDLPRLQRAILDRCDSGTINYKGWNGLEITAPLASLSRAVESAFVLTPREALPKITATSKGGNSRSFTASNNLGVTVQGGTSASARQSAALWLAIAGLLEKEEKDAAEEAKRQADADKAAVSAKHVRLDELASEYFDEDSYDDLGTKKARVIDELHRLEQELEADDEDYGDDE